MTRGLFLPGPAIVAALLAVASCTIQDRTDRPVASTAAADRAARKEIIVVPGAPSPAVLSSAVRSGDLVFLSGALGALPGVAPITLVEGGIREEARQALQNLQTVVETAGGTMADMIKCTVFLADMADYAALNEVYLEFFPSDPPARSAMGVNGLAFGARVEIECIAAVPRRR